MDVITKATTATTCTPRQQRSQTRHGIIIPPRRDVSIFCKVDGVGRTLRRGSTPRGKKGCRTEGYQLIRNHGFQAYFRSLERVTLPTPSQVVETIELRRFDALSVYLTEKTFLVWQCIASGSC